MKYILVDKKGERDLEFRITKKDSRFIEGTMYKVYGGSKGEPYFYSYHADINLRYEGICNISFLGSNGDGLYHVSGANGMLHNMRVYAFLSKIALLESKNATGYVSNFEDVANLELLDGYTVEFLETENFVPSRCKCCCHFKDFECTRESSCSDEIGVCWLDEEY